MLFATELHKWVHFVFNYSTHAQGVSRWRIHPAPLRRAASHSFSSSLLSLLATLATTRAILRHALLNSIRLLSKGHIFVFQSEFTYEANYLTVFPRFSYRRLIQITVRQFFVGIVLHSLNLHLYKSWKSNYEPCNFGSSGKPFLDKCVISSVPIASASFWQVKESRHATEWVGWARNSDVTGR